MSDKLIWSSNMTADMLRALPIEHLRLELEDYGYDAEMLADLSQEELIGLVDNDDYMWQDDAEDFEYNVAPKLAKQTKDGIILLSGTAGRWDGNKAAGKAVAAEDLVGGDICKDCDYIALYDVDGNVVWEATHHDGTHYMGLYAVPEDKEKFGEFLQACMSDYIEDELDYNESTVEDVIDYAYNYDLDADTINDYCDFSKVPEVCEPIKAANVQIESCEEPIEEAKAKHPDTLAMEVQSIKDDYEDFGPEGFYAVPFSRFAKQYPEFTESCIKTYLKEIEILEPEELDDPEVYEQYWQTGELILPEDWPILIDGAERLSSDRAEKGYTWITLLKKYQRPYDEENESLNEAAPITVPATVVDYSGEYETYLQGSGLQDYGFYQGDLILDNEYDKELTDKIRENCAEGDEVLVKLEATKGKEFPYKVVDVIIKSDESLTEDFIEATIEPAPQVDCTMQTATNVMNAYQCANKWLDIVKEIVYTNLGCVFFSSYIHELAHTMPGRFDAFGAILHTANMRIPYPETPYIPNEPTSIDEVFGSLFMCLNNIKIALNDFIKCTDEQYHGMACAAEGLLNDIEGEYPTIYRLQQEWQNSNGDLATFDKYVGQFIEHKDDLLA